MSPTNQFPHGARSTSAAPARANSGTTRTRKDFTDKLGLPKDATNAQVFAALDAKLAARPATTVPAQTAAQRQQAADDALYDLAYGAGTPSTELSAQDADLYDALFGGTDA